LIGLGARIKNQSPKTKDRSSLLLMSIGCNCVASRREEGNNMRMKAAVLLLLTVFGFSACSGFRAGTASAAAVDARFQPTNSFEAPSSSIDFTTQIKPIFEARCQPCHFNGGKVYATLPFDGTETIKKLGTKLFTRIKDEKEQQLIRQFLAQE